MKRNARLRFRWNLIRYNKLNSIHPSSSFSSFPYGKNMLIESKLRSHLGFLHLVTWSPMRSHVLRASMHAGCISAKEGVKVTPARVHFAPICVYTAHMNVSEHDRTRIDNKLALSIRSRNIRNVSWTKNQSNLVTFRHGREIMSL